MAIEEDMEQTRTGEVGQTRTGEPGGREAPPSPTDPRQQQSQVPHPVHTPYQPYPYPQQPFAVPAPAIAFDKTWHWIKIMLVSASLVCCAIVLGLSIATSRQSYSSLSSTFLWCTLTIVAALWDIAELITVFTCGRRHSPDARHGIHPGAHVGVDLILWLSGVLATLVASIVYVELQSARRRCENYLSSESNISYSSYYCDSEEYAVLQSNSFLSSVIAIIVFISLLTIVHFIIFVRACMETNQRNRLRQTVMMIPSIYYGPSPGMVSYGDAYPAHDNPYHGHAMNEKSVATRPQNGQSSLAGFYAPVAPLPAVHASPRPRD